MQLMNIVADRDKISEILRSYMAVSHVPICFIEKLEKSYYNVLTDCGFCNYIRKNQEVSDRCHVCDRQAFFHVTKTKSSYLYQCHIGLWEAIHPLFLHDKLVGFLMTGHIAQSGEERWNEIEQKLLDLHFSKDEIALAQSEYKQKQKYTPEEINGLFELMKMVGDHLLRTGAISIFNSPVIDQVLYYIGVNINQELSVNQICEQFQLSPSALAAKFKDATGHSVREYIERLRLNTALESLELTALSVKEIAFQCGFHDTNYFCRIFKKRFGSSPMQYRAQVLQKSLNSSSQTADEPLGAGAAGELC